MLRKKISDQTKWTIVSYYQLQMPIGDIAQAVGVSWDCARNTIVRFEENGDIKEKKPPGRKKNTSKRDDLKLLRLSRAYPFKSIHKLQQEWTLNGEPIGKFLILNYN